MAEQRGLPGTRLQSRSHQGEVNACPVLSSLLALSLGEADEDTATYLGN